MCSMTRLLALTWVLLPLTAFSLDMSAVKECITQRRAEFWSQVAQNDSQPGDSPQCPTDCVQGFADPDTPSYKSLGSCAISHAGSLSDLCPCADLLAQANFGVCCPSDSWFSGLCSSAVSAIKNAGIQQMEHYGHCDDYLALMVDRTENVLPATIASFAEGDIAQPNAMGAELAGAGGGVVAAAALAAALCTSLLLGATIGIVWARRQAPGCEAACYLPIS